MNVYYQNDINSRRQFIIIDQPTPFINLIKSKFQTHSVEGDYIRVCVDGYNGKTDAFWSVEGGHCVNERVISRNEMLEYFEILGYNVHIIDNNSSDYDHFEFAVFKYKRG